MLNSLPICEGVITRRRILKNKIEEAVLDYFIICDKMKKFLERMVIDEDKLFPLSRYDKGIRKDSDHNTLILWLNICYQMKKPERIELFNFKNEECQEKFFNKTELSTSLQECFQNRNSLEIQTNDWFKTLKSYFHQCFKKIGCTSVIKPTETDKLLKLRTELIQKEKKLRKLRKKIY